MDVDDFPVSPAKRQRTLSPEPSSIASQIHPSQPAADSEAPAKKKHEISSPAENLDRPAVDQGATQAPDAISNNGASNALLDALMLQVEAESSPVRDVQQTANPPAANTHEEAPPIDAVLNTEDVGKVGDEGQHIEAQGSESTPLEPPTNAALATDPDRMDTTDDTIEDGVARKEDTAVPAPDGDATQITARISDQTPVPISAATDVIPPSEAPVPEAQAEGAEWEIDSSPYESSDSDSSSEDSSSEEEDSDDDADGDYAMLDPEEAARILMHGDGGSDDEGGRSREKADGATLRTANERPEEVIPKPDIIITEEMKIEELGNVEFIVESTVVIKAKISGEYQVLEAGSLVCLEGRTVVGVVADLIGRVEEPRYTIRFTNDDDIRDAGVSEIGATVFYVPQHSTFVFTQPLKSVKGSDASNFHDEEVGDDELEFSDDEAEAEHKRQVKARRQGRQSEQGRGRGGSKFGRGAHRGGRGGHSTGHANQGSAAYGNGSLEMNYDEVPDGGGDEGYTPLQRPSNLAEMMNKREPPQEGGMKHPLPPPPPSSFVPPSSFGGRGDFGRRGRGHNRGARGGGPPQHRSGAGSGHSRGSSSSHDNYRDYNQDNQGGGFSQNAHSSAPLPNLNLPTTPSLSSQNMPYPPMTPSPMTPLPNVSYNFPGFGPPGGFPSFFPPMPQQSSMSGMMPPPPFLPNFLPPPPHQQQQNHQGQNQNHGQHQFPQQQQQQQQQQQAYAGSAAPSNFLSGAWASNPAIAAALQKQAEEQRRNQGYQGQGQGH